MLKEWVNLSTVKRWIASSNWIHQCLGIQVFVFQLDNNKWPIALWASCVWRQALCTVLSVTFLGEARTCKCFMVLLAIYFVLSDNLVLKQEEKARWSLLNINMMVPVLWCRPFIHVLCWHKMGWVAGSIHPHSNITSGWAPQGSSSASALEVADCCSSTSLCHYLDDWPVSAASRESCIEKRTLLLLYTWDSTQLGQQVWRCSLTEESISQNGIGFTKSGAAVLSAVFRLCWPLVTRVG